MKLTYYTFISIVWLTVIATICESNIGDKPTGCDKVYTWYDMLLVFLLILSFWFMGFMVGKDYTKNKM